MEKSFTDEMIVETYEEIIDGLILNNDFVKRKYAISLIREILESGVDPLDLDKIEYICMKFIDIKNLSKINGVVYGDYIGGFSDYNEFKFSNNKNIIHEAIKSYDDKIHKSR